MGVCRRIDCFSVRPFLVRLINISNNRYNLYLTKFGSMSGLMINLFCHAQREAYDVKSNTIVKVLSRHSIKKKHLLSIFLFLFLLSLYFHLLQILSSPDLLSRTVLSALPRYGVSSTEETEDDGITG